MTEPGKVTEMNALNDLFAQARAAEPMPDAALLARIMTDAVQTDQDRRPTALALWRPAQANGWFAALLANMGGWPAVGGLAMATVTGLWIGVAAPDSLSAMTAALWGETVTVSLDARDDLFGLEG